MADQITRAADAAEHPDELARQLWAYLDARDAARAFALAVERDLPGRHVINVMAPDSISPERTAALMTRFHPTTERRRPLVGREVPYDLTRAHDLLGFEAEYLLPRNR